MTGLEIKKTYAKALYEEEKGGTPVSVNKILLTVNPTNIEVEVNTSSEDIILMRFNSQNRKDYAQMAINIWLNKISTYNLTGEGDVALIPEEYWSIYKGTHSGQQILKGVGYRMFINEEEHKFVSTDYYFKDKTPAVYGIYHNDEIIYIGSSTNYTQRWGEHILGMMGVQRHWKNNPKMYSGLKDYMEELEFKILYSEEEMREMMGIDESKFFSSYMMEYIEEKCIGHYKPKYNKAGVSSPFQYKGKRPMFKDYMKMSEKIDANLIFD